VAELAQRRTRAGSLDPTRSRVRSGAPLCVCLALFSALLPASAARAEEAPPRPEITALRFSGVESVPESTLRDAILSRAPDWRPWVDPPELDEAELAEDMDRIRSAYRRQGFYEARAEYRLEWEDDAREEVAIEIRVEEGPPVWLLSFEVELPPGDWLREEARAALLLDLPLVLDQRFSAKSYSEAKALVLARLADEGYAAARLSGGAKVELRTHTASVAWRVVPGPLVHFGEVEVRGLAQVERELVTRELGFERGERYSLSELEASRRRIYDTGLFRAVTLQPVRGAVPPEAGPADAVEWPLVATVDERPPRSLSASIGYGTEEQYRARLAWEHRNFFGEARRLELSGRYSAIVSGVEARFRQPRFLWPRLTLSAKTSALHEEQPSYTSNGLTLGYLLSHPLLFGVDGRVGQNFELADVTDLDVLDPSGEESYQLSSLVFGLSRNALDDPLDPSRGSFVDLSAEPTLRGLGSDRDFVTLAARGSWFTPLPRLPALVLLARLDLAVIQPFAATRRDQVPIVSRLFAGGTGSVRGFELDQLGPVDANGEALGGLTRTFGTLELRFPIWKILGGVVFADAGQVARDPWEFDRGVFSVAVGPGLRVKTPIGAIGIDYGYLLRRPREIDRDRFHFSVGVSF